MTRFDINRLLAVVLSGLLLVGGVTIASAVPFSPGSGLEQPAVSVIAEQDSDSPTVTFENQTTDGTSVTVRSVTIPEGGFIAIHNESGAIVGHSEYLSPVRYKNVTVSVTLGASASQSQLTQMRSLLNQTQSRERVMFAMMNQTVGPGMMQEQTRMHGHVHDVVQEQDRHQLMHQMLNQSLNPEMVAHMLNQTQDYQQMHTLMQSMMVNQSMTQEMIELMNRTEERETLMFQLMLNQTVDPQQMEALMLNQTRDFAQMHLLMAQFHSQLPSTEGQTLTAMLHRDTNGNEEFDFPEADDPYTVDDEPVTDSAQVIVQGSIQNETTAEV